MAESVDPGERPDPDRAGWVTATMIELSEVLSSDFGLDDLLAVVCRRCSALFEGADVGVLLADEDRGLQVALSSSERAQTVETFEVALKEGPGFETYRQGERQLNEPLAGHPRWPGFASHARDEGFEIVTALPLRNKEHVLGSVNILGDANALLSGFDAEVTQSFADFASYAIAQERRIGQIFALADQLQHALSSRIVIEQAKGVLSERLGIDVNGAFQLMRRYSQNRNEPLAEVARRVVARVVATEEIAAGARAAKHTGRIRRNLHR